MKLHGVRTAITVVVAAAIALAATPLQAQAATWTDAQAASANSSWLASNLVDGGVKNPLSPVDLPDYGLMVDIILAMYASGDGAKAAPIVDRLEKEAQNYYTDRVFNPSANGRKAGPVAKVLVGALTAGRDPHNFAGADLVAEVKATITPDGPRAGKVRDYGSGVHDNANMFGQSLAIFALAGAGDLPRPVVDSLLSQQCSDGFFRLFYGKAIDGKTETCDQGKAIGRSPEDRDTTAMGLSALVAARQAGITGLDEPIARAVAWLENDQRKSTGGWIGSAFTPKSNTNSTGLVVQALASACGNPDVIARGAGFIRSLQVEEGSQTNPDDVGAIVYGIADFGSSGSLKVDTTIRASAQASLGLSRASMWTLVSHKQLPSCKTSGSDDSYESKPVPKPVPKPTATATVTTTVTPPPLEIKVPGDAPPKTISVALPQPLPASREKATPPALATPQAKSGGTSADPTALGRMSRYLASQLVDGNHVETSVDGKTYVDYDTTAEVALALRTLGGEREAAIAASDFLLRPESIQAYVHGVPYEKDGAVHVAPLAKVTLLATMRQREIANPQEYSAQLMGFRMSLTERVTREGALIDAGETHDAEDSLRRTALGVLALTATGANEQSKMVASALMKTQCSDGGFPEKLHTGKCTTSDPAATGWAAQALATVPKAVGSANSLEPLPDARHSVLVKTQKLLNRLPSADGLVISGSAYDLDASSAVAAGRQALGLDSSAAARSMATFIRTDGRVATAESGVSDLHATLAAVPAAAGGSWIARDISAVVPALVDTRRGSTQDHQPAANDPWWSQPWALAAWGLAACGAGFLIRRWGSAPTPN